MINFEEVYATYLDYKNEENRKERYEGNEHWYGASSSGSCRRKLYYKNVVKAATTNKSSDESMRKMRLGTIFHDDMEKALELHNNNKNGEAVKFYYEDALEIPAYNVRGFFDCVAEMPSGEIYLYDFKTAGSYPWKLKFGRAGKPEDPRYSMQLGMYGQAVKERFGRLDGMYLVYYNKDTSKMRTVDVDLHWIEKAKDWWAETKLQHLNGLPPLKPGENPSAAWECNFCEWKDHCLN